MQNIITQHITKTPEVCGGRACIAGHRIRVMDIVVCHEFRAMSPAEIVFQFPGITVADVHAALVYYFDNQDEITQEFQNDEERATWLRANVPSKIPSAIRSAMERTGG